MKTRFILLSLFAATSAVAADPDGHQQAVRMITSGSDISSPREGLPAAREIVVAQETDAHQKAARLLDRPEPNGPPQVGTSVRVSGSYPNDAHAYAARLLGGSAAVGSNTTEFTQLAGESKAAQ
jgi:hypothetical protein